MAFHGKAWHIKSTIFIKSTLHFKPTFFHQLVTFLPHLLVTFFGQKKTIHIRAYSMLRFWVTFRNHKAFQYVCSDIVLMEQQCHFAGLVPLMVEAFLFQLYLPYPSQPGCQRRT